MTRPSVCFAALLLATIYFAAVPVHADPGVGVNLGRIEINDRLAPGGKYTLPLLGVINAGDEPGEYEVDITYEEGQSRKRPPATWISFSPRRFFLEPKQTKSVEMHLTLPAGADPGDYFAYIEAHPVSKGQGAVIWHRGGNEALLHDQAIQLV